MRWFLTLSLAVGDPYDGIVPPQMCPRNNTHGCITLLNYYNWPYVVFNHTKMDPCTLPCEADDKRQFFCHKMDSTILANVTSPEKYAIPMTGIRFLLSPSGPGGILGLPKIHQLVVPVPIKELNITFPFHVKNCDMKIYIIDKDVCPPLDAPPVEVLEYFEYLSKDQFGGVNPWIARFKDPALGTPNSKKQIVVSDPEKCVADANIWTQYSTIHLTHLIPFHYDHDGQRATLLTAILAPLLTLGLACLIG